MKRKGLKNRRSRRIERRKREKKGSKENLWRQSCIPLPLSESTQTKLFLGSPASICRTVRLERLLEPRYSCQNFRESITLGSLLVRRESIRKSWKTKLIAKF